jgi:AmmeMemoRadiSam system protein A
MNDKQKQELLKIAKNSVEAAVKGEDIETPQTDDEQLKAHRGCFVTLKNGGELRGCIGQFISDKPLIETVCDMGRSASTGDPRFRANPITSDELKELDIEISVLSELELTDEPMSLRLGVDGIYIKRGMASGCFLPQVAEETGWSKEEFLSYCCAHKAGLRPDAWKEKDTEVYLFTAEIFGANFSEI